MACLIIQGPNLKNRSVLIVFLTLFPGLLWTGALKTLITNLTERKVNFFSLTDCILGFFIHYFCLTYSSALLVIIFVERFIALYFPFKAKAICTSRIARMVTFVTTLIYAIFNGQFLFIALTHDKNGYDDCYFNVSFGYVNILYNILISMLYSFGPLIIMIIINITIIFKFNMAKLRNTNNNSNSTNQALSKSAVRATTMLPTVSFAFIILTGPIAIVTYNGMSPINLVILRSPQYLNNAINSVLYCVSESRFRKELMEVICCRKTNSEGNSPSGNVTGTTSVNNVHITTSTL